MYRVFLSDPARHYYDRLPANIQQRINRAIDRLEHDPTLGPTIRRLTGDLTGLYRIRIGSFRVIYRIDESAQEVEVVAIGPRGDVY